MTFWNYVARLKTEQRQGWRRLSPKRRESVADHSYGTAMLALFEGERRGWDVETLLKLALLHDLEESITGDLTPEGKKRRGLARVRRERRLAVRKLLSTLPVRCRASYQKLWSDLRLSRTREAKLVHQLDKIELALQAHEYSKSTKLEVTDFYQSARAAVHDRALAETLDSFAS
jgi:5'-deoxynucleotidase